MAKIYYESSLSHKGIKGMKWGFNDGKRNGKRTAGETIKDWLGFDEYDRFQDASYENYATAVRLDGAEYEARREQDSKGYISAETLAKYLNADIEHAVAGQNYMKAHKDLLRTPYGIALATANTIREGINFVKGLFKKDK